MDQLTSLKILDSGMHCSVTRAMDETRKITRQVTKKEIDHERIKR